MKVSTIFVTGMQRSGTTLLDKLLGNHPVVSILSQPFPFLFLEVKRAFFRSLGLEPPRYVLSPLFRETRYAPGDFAGFLERYVIDRVLLEKVFFEMEEFSGQYTRFSRRRLEVAFAAFQPGNLTETLSQLYRLLAHKPGAIWYGGKETLCEEFLPYLLGRGVRVILILRDPREILVSLNYGEGSRFAGHLKPTLFNVRNWRKSVAFALHLDGHPGFHWLRYEDLVAEPLPVLDQLTRFLGIEPFGRDVFDHGIRDQDGRIWQGNSSHGAVVGISPSSVRRYRELLPPSVISFVEASCYPELRYLAYPLTLPRSELTAALERFADPYAVERADLADYLPNARNIADELARLAILDGVAAGPVREFFLFDRIPSLLGRHLR